ncbi:MAG TPA: UrcA family protein [Sphingomicrobium sp.]
MKQGLKIVFAAGLVTAGLIKGVPAAAQTVPLPEINISYVHTADLDLSSRAGQRTLDLRLARAARDVCGTASDVDLEGRNDVRKCRDDTLASARAKRDGLIAAADSSGTIAIAAVR